MSSDGLPEHISCRYQDRRPGSRSAGMSSTASERTNVAKNWFDNATAPRINTDVYMYNLLKRAHPDLQMFDTDANNANIIDYLTATGEGSIEAIPGSRHSASSPQSMHNIYYIPPARRSDTSSGGLAAQILFDKFLIQWKGHEFLIYIVNGRDGSEPYPETLQQYILSSPSSSAAALDLVKATGTWTNTLHDEIWVFDNYWQKDAQLYQSIQKSKWENIILPEALKEDLLDTVLRFYDAKDQYSRYGVPWKRGLIFHGPPGNGKTVSIKATMKTLYDRNPAIPTLYVKSFTSFGGPEYSISQVFRKARQQAPCYLVFEDLDSLVTDQVRSFFLNAVDGLSENDGLLMVGSTNHLDRLDPGLAKRPSRFDRKYLFDNPDTEQREKYCQFWQQKIKKSHAVEFPNLLINPIAALMDGFSFAFMQEAFVSTLLQIVYDSDDKQDVRPKSAHMEDDAWDMVELTHALGKSKDKDDGGDGLMKYKLWRVIKAQISNLRKEIGGNEE